MGIIDYIRLYDAVKRIESGIKRMTSALAAGGAQPTVIAPAPYADRLLRSLNRYFVGCPNKWTCAVEGQGNASAVTGTVGAASASDGDATSRKAM